MFITIIFTLLITNIPNFGESETSAPQTSQTSTCSGGTGDETVCLAEDKVHKQNCNLTPQSYEGPFYLPNQPIRRDIREGRPGVPLKIEFVVRNTSCQPVKDVQVHVWQTDALGVYSAYSGYYPLGEPGSKEIKHPHSEPTEKAEFLRGIQVTDSNGKATILTIYPGWYRYRTLHLHFKITDMKGRDIYVGEIYFPDEFTDKIAKLPPYKEHDGKRLKNRQDSQFLHDDGQFLVMKPNGNFDDGLEGQMEIIIPSEKL